VALGGVLLLALLLLPTVIAMVTGLGSTSVPPLLAVSTACAGLLAIGVSAVLYARGIERYVRR
jgi:hypothetical protein